MKRAYQTAEIISETIGKNIEVSDLFVERKRPSEQYGIRRDSNLYINSDKFIVENFTNPNKRFSDEEKFDDLKKRVDKVIEFLESRSENNILVTTHGFFLRVILARVIFGKNLKSEELYRFLKVVRTTNTGLTVFNYDESNKKSPWTVKIWNDHAHLG